MPVSSQRVNEIINAKCSKSASHVYNIYKLIGSECWYISLVVNVLVVDVFVSLCNFT